MSFLKLDSQALTQVTQKLETLAKSFAAGTPGLEASGRTGLSALATDKVDDVLRSITMEEEDFLLTKDIQNVPMSSTVYSYRVKTAVGQQGLIDLAGTETFLPQEDAPQYMRVGEVAKIYGIKVSISHLATLVNDKGMYSLDLEQELDHNAALSMGRQFEQDFYHGGDYYIDAQGNIDYLIASSSNNSSVVRKLRGIQANVREGNRSARGIPGDYIGYGNSRSVVFNRNGGVLERGHLDKVVQSVRDNLGKVDEAHCTPGHLTEFRATFFPTERSQLNQIYSIKGPDVNIEERRGFAVETVTGPLAFVSNVHKYLLQRPVQASGSSGAAPATPAVTPSAGASNTGSKFLAGEGRYYTVQAVSISGRGQPSAPQLVTTTVAGAYNELAITNVAGAEYYDVFCTDKSDATAGKEMFIGRAVRSLGATTTFRDNGKIIPGLDSILLLPKSKNRVKMGTIGNMLNKLELGVKGLGFEWAYASYLACIVDRPRSCALIDNVFQNRAVLEDDELV
jgi:hypothetical protein